ncbi:Uma2 family endonuclease [Streptomyces xantholiticus]|uniref:Uma2 family endonuclease n=1 Tax=Streptomyces xantholiticus TaxID=68285 RepID=A0ABV1UWS9_9ACTN
MIGGGALARLMPRTPRGIARMISRATTLRVEILGGSLVLSRTDCATRAEVVRRLTDDITPHLAMSPLAVEEAVPIAMPQDPDDYAIPDLAVRTGGTDRGHHGPVRPEGVHLVVEVVPRTAVTPELARKRDWYAIAGVRALLFVDPRHGTWALHGDPGPPGSYRHAVTGKFGVDVRLPEPLDFPVATGGLPEYGDSGADPTGR